MKRARKTVRKTAAMVLEDPELNARDAEDEAAREEAFQADEAEWNGVALKPFSSGRESLFFTQRLAAGAPELAAALDDVDAFFADAIRILYLCSHDPAEWRHLRAKPLEWQEEIERWADENIPLADKGKAVLVAMKIIEQAYANRHEPAPAERGGKKTMGK